MIYKRPSVFRRALRRIMIVSIAFLARPGSMEERHDRCITAKKLQTGQCPTAMPALRTLKETYSYIPPNAKRIEQPDESDAAPTTSPP